MSARSLTRGTPPSQDAFIDALLVQRGRAGRGFTPAWDHTVPAGTGYGFRVQAGQAFRLVMTEAAQIVDLCLANAEDPTEHLAPGTQHALEGGFVTRGTTLWGTPPLTRPLAYVTADTLTPTEDAAAARDHICHGAHCNPHHWVLYTGRHPRTCYDNLRAGFAMLGLGQRDIHDNLNLFQRTAIDPVTGQHVLSLSDAVAGDYLEFYAVRSLAVVMSLCPQGSGVDPNAEADGAGSEAYREVPTYPVRVEVHETGITLPETVIPSSST